MVRAGDTLWGIARSLAGQGASDATVARLVDGLWALNAPVIGTGDPDMIRTGVTLRLPAT
jgi:nucleoid-associated protein YgaU